MIGIFVLLTISLFFGILAVFCLKGVDWVLINGVNTLSKEEQQEFKDKYDMIAMNRYIGKRILLPLALLCLIYVPIIAFETLDWMQSAWFGILVIVVSIGGVVVLCSALPKILNFEKWVRKE